MRKVAILALAFLLALAAACEIALPFDRSLIPEEGGTSGTDSTVPGGDDATTLEDSSPTEDAFVPPGEAGDAAVGDGPADAQEGSAGDGSADGMSIVDASPDAGDASDAVAAD